MACLYGMPFLCIVLHFHAMLPLNSTVFYYVLQCSGEIFGSFTINCCIFAEYINNHLNYG